MGPTAFLVEETFRSQNEEERRSNLQRLMEQYIKTVLRQAPA